MAGKPSRFDETNPNLIPVATKRSTVDTPNDEAVMLAPVSAGSQTPSGGPTHTSEQKRNTCPEERAHQRNGEDSFRPDCIFNLEVVEEESEEEDALKRFDVEVEVHNPERKGHRQSPVDEGCENYQAPICHKQGKLVYLTQHYDSLLRIELSINDTSVTAVVDTGSTGSLMSEQVAKQLKLDIEEYVGKISAINEAEFSVVGKCCPNISIAGERTKSVDFLVVPSKINVQIPIVLGVDFLQSNNFEICPGDRLVIRHNGIGGSTEFYLSGSGKIRRKMIRNEPCYATESMRIPSGKVIPVPITNSVVADGAPFMMYSDDYIDASRADELRGYAGVFNSSVPFVLMMSSEASVEVKKGQCVGSVSTILELPEDNDVFSADEWSNEKLREVVSLPEISDSQKTLVYEMLSKYSSVLSMGDHDLGKAAVTEHNIKLYSDTPIYQRPRRFPAPIADEIERQCAELCSLDIIEPSISPWASPVVPIRKKDGSIRLCIDYRKLNHVTIPDKFPMPNLTDSIFGLKGTKFFTRFDLVRGYYQLPINADSREYTAFCTPKNHWQFKRLSFGLRNAPATFQREIQAVLKSFPSNKVIAYIDDILIMGESFEEHLSLVGKVLQTLQSHCIKVKPSKCEWFQSQVEYLGHIVGRDGIRKTHAYLKKVEEYPRPENLGELREFLGLLNFQRKFVPHCSEIQKPLSSRTSGRKNKKLEWNAEMEEAFHELKRQMARDMELAYPDYSDKAEKLELWVDASASGAGAYLAQVQGGSSRVIGFASMCFTGTQLNYSTLERELTALRWGVKTFRPFLYGIEFLLYTDHQPLIHLHNMKLVCSRLARTLEELSDFCFEIRYTPGRLNSAADALSRVRDIEVNRPMEEASDALPEGLVVCGELVPGGGDSLFISVHRLLSRLALEQSVPNDDLGLRQLICDEVLRTPSRYNVKMTRAKRREYRLIRNKGQLPPISVLLVISRLFSVRIVVYFWSEQPVVYQWSDYPRVLYLQCVSGIHFNPLMELQDFSGAREYDVETPGELSIDRGIQVEAVESEKTCNEDSFESDEELSNIFLAHAINKCDHDEGAHLMVDVQCSSLCFCAVVDTGAEISLMSVGALDRLKSLQEVQVIQENMCEIVGLSGVREPIGGVVEIKVKVGSFEFMHRFAVVSADVVPCCFILGLDFFKVHGIGVDLFSRCLRKDRSCVTRFRVHEGSCSRDNVVMMGTVCIASHQLMVSDVDGGLRFEISGNSSSVRGLSLLLEDGVIGRVQGCSDELGALRHCLNARIPSGKWSQELHAFKRYANRLEVEDDAIIFVGPSRVFVVPFEMYLEVALILHYRFAHVGRDKLMCLLDGLMWHPARYRVINDICSSCPRCQLIKTSALCVVPPTLRVVTSYPFELLAVDLVALPRTAAGFIGCLVAVDHYSKWVSMIPIKNKKSVTIATALAERVFPFLIKIPSKILSDNGPEFAGGEFSAFLEVSGIDHVLTTPYHPASNGCVERVNRTIQAILRGLECKADSWDKFLAKAVTIYNNTSHAQINMSPASFLLTKAHEVDGVAPVESVVPKHWRIGHPKFVPFQVGERVVMKCRRVGNVTSNKLEPVYKGPFSVGKVNENGVTYQLENPGGREVIRAHHSDLFLFKETPKYIADHPFFIEMNSSINPGLSAGMVSDELSSSEDEAQGDSLGGVVVVDVSEADSDSDASRGSSASREASESVIQSDGGGEHVRLSEEGPSVSLVCRKESCPCCSRQAVPDENTLGDKRTLVSPSKTGEVDGPQLQPLLKWDSSFGDFSCGPEPVENDVGRGGMESGLSLLDTPVPGEEDGGLPVLSTVPAHNSGVGSLWETDGELHVGGRSMESDVTLVELEDFINSAYLEHAQSRVSTQVQPLSLLEEGGVRVCDKYRIAESTPISEGGEIARRFTRSAGPVENLPYVQPRVLERRIRK